MGTTRKQVTFIFKWPSEMLHGLLESPWLVFTNVLLVKRFLVIKLLMFSTMKPKESTFSQCIDSLNSVRTNILLLPRIPWDSGFVCLCKKNKFKNFGFY